MDGNRYKNLNYNFLDRFTSFWYQIKEVLELAPGKMLEIGVGNKTVNNYLKGAGLEVISLDIDPGLKPDVVGSVEKMPFSDKEFDLVLCAEVLEHLPFEKFAGNLQEIRRVAKSYLVLTLPHWGRHFSIDIRLPFFGRLKQQFKLNLFPVKHKFNGQHFWEIGKRGYPLKKVRQVIRDSGFKILKDYVVFEMPYHHMFVLKVL